MSMHRSAYSRGASVFGVLVLVGILSGVAIVFDQQSIAQNSFSQVAAVTSITCDSFIGFTDRKCEKIEGKSVLTGIDIPSSEYQNLICQIGNDFIIRMDGDGKNAKIYYADKNGNLSNAKISQCQSKSADERVGARACTDEGQNKWHCYVKVCFRSSKQSAKSGEVVCGPFRTDKPIEVGKLVAEKGGAASKALTRSSAETGSMVSALGAASSDLERQELKAQLDSGESSASAGILDAYKKDTEASFNEARNDYQYKLQALADCEAQHQEDGNGNACLYAKNTAELAGKNFTEKEKQLQEMQKYTQDLQGYQTSLQPAGGVSGCQSEACASAALAKDKAQPLKNDPRFQAQTFGGDSSKGETPSKDQSGKSTNAGLGGQDDPYRRFFGLNTGQAQDDYCVVQLQPIVVHQYQARPGCYNYRSGASGAYGAYGGYPGQGSNRCGSQPNFGGGLGGIIGGVISLFTNRGGGSSNCTPDGVPLPQCTITASPTSIQSPGQQVTLSWQSQDAFAATLSSQGSVGVNGSQVVQPQQTTTYTLSLQGYRNTQTGQVLSGQCSTQVVVGGAGTSTSGDPKAQIACSPQTADVGMSVAVSYSCLNSNTSSGSGFSTNNQLSGSATPTVTAPTIGSDSVTYGLTCSRDGKTDSAQCTVGVNKTALVLIANPSEVESGEEANIGWVTTGMQACTISSPDLSGFTSDNAGNTSVSGVARTPPLTSDARFVLTCTTRSGATKTAETRVQVGN